MTKATMAIITCDYEEGCDQNATDFYEECASTVDGVRITTTTRHPGWVSTEETDLCPEHAPELGVEGGDRG